MDWRIASTRPIALSAANRRIALVTSLTVAAESTSQWETRAPVLVEVDDNLDLPRWPPGPLLMPYKLATTGRGLLPA